MSMSPWYSFSPFGNKQASDGAQKPSTTEPLQQHSHYQQSQWSSSPSSGVALEEEQLEVIPVQDDMPVTPSWLSSEPATPSYIDEPTPVSYEVDSPQVTAYSPLSHTLDGDMQDILPESESLNANKGDNSESVMTLEERGVSPRLVLLRHTLLELQQNISRALELINEEMQGSGAPIAEISQVNALLRSSGASMMVSPVVQATDNAPLDGRVVEGVFDGQNMMGVDGKQYSVPPNYASKSKLVEGDLMKLTITTQGTFIYKQIRPIERQRLIAKLDQNPETHEFVALLGEQRWRVLTASVTYFKGAAGDEIVIMVPKDIASKWAAVENIIKKI